MKKSNIIKALAMLLVLVMVIGSVPVSAAKNVTAGSKKAFEKALKAEKAATITFSTEASGKIVLHSNANSANKKLVVDAPNADIVNYANYKSVNVKACKSYTEKGEENVLYVKDSNAKVEVAKNTAVAKIVVQTKKISITANSGATMSVFAKKAGTKISVNAKASSVVGVSVDKKANLNIKGSENAFVAIASKAEGSKVTASMPIILEAEQDVAITLNKGAEGSMLDKANDAIEVALTNKSEEPIFVTIGGELPPVNPDNASTAAISVEGVN